MAGRVGLNNLERKVTALDKNLKIVTKNTEVNNKKDDLAVEDEDLDYEPDDVDFESSLKSNLIGNQQEIQTDISGLCLESPRISDCENNFTEKCYNHENSLSLRKDLCEDGMENNNFSTFSNYNSEDHTSTASHKSNMLPYDRSFDNAQDGRQDLYLTIPIINTGKVLLDSSSSSSSSSSVDRSTNFSEDISDNNSVDSDQYNMTNDEENRLLQSDEEVSLGEDGNLEGNDKNDAHVNVPELIETTDHPVFQQSEITMKGKNIIIKAFSKPKEHKIWNIRFHPYKHITLFLDEIGFVPLPRRISESESSNKSDRSSVISRTSSNEHPVTTLPTTTNYKITISGNQKRTISAQKEGESGSSQESHAFKVPALPPAKRPPSRPPKRNSGSSTSGSTNSISISPASSITDPSENHTNVQFYSRDRRFVVDDDVISVSHSSIRSNLEDLDHNLEDLDPEFIKEEDTYEDFDSNIMARNKDVADWINNSQNQIDETLNFNRKPNRPVNFKGVDPFFGELCYFHYLKGHCRNINCRKSHCAPPSFFSNRCKDSTPAHLQVLFSFTLNYPPLFFDLYPAFLEGFAFHKMQNNILKCIDHIFTSKAGEPDGAVEKIIDALMETGLTFTQAVAKINLTVGPSRYPLLADYLLEILSTKDNISENWEEIKLICRSKSFISPEIVKRIIKSLLGGPYTDKDIVKDVHNTIIKSEKTDLSKIDNDLLGPMNMLMQFGNNSTSPKGIIDNRNSSMDQHSRDSLSNECREPLNVDLRLTSQSPTSLLPSRRNLALDEDQRRPFRFSPPPPSNKSASSSTGSPYVPLAPGIIQLSPLIPSQPVPNFALIDTSVPPPPIITRRVSQNNVTVVSTGPEVDLCPEIPIFGKFNYRQGFSFDSLHNLLPNFNDQVQIHESDIVRLNEIIQNGNGAGFLQLLHNYKKPNTLQHFITMSIAHIKNSGRRPYNTFIDLIENVGIVQPDFKKDSFMKAIFEVIVFNLLFILERNCQYHEARKLLETFCDWDSLVSSKLLQQFAIHALTPMGRYLFIAKLLANAKGFYLVYDILHSSDLHLLKSPNLWPLFSIPNVDVEVRDVVLKLFFKSAHHFNVEVVCDMYRNIFQFGEIWNFDALTYFNPILEFLISKEKIAALKHFFVDIDIFYKKMSVSVLKKFIICMESHLNNEHKFKLYDIAVQKNIYAPYKGTEPMIIIRTDSHDNELKLIFQYYMNKMLSIQYELNHDLKIIIKLPVDGTTSKDTSIKTRSVAEVYESIQQILNECFGINYRPPENSGNAVICIKRTELKSIF